MRKNPVLVRSCFHIRLTNMAGIYFYAMCSYSDRAVTHMLSHT